MRLDAIDLRIEPERGVNWIHQAPGYRYREVAPELWRRIGTSQILWCSTIRGDGFVRPTEDVDLAEWEISVPPARAIAYTSSPAWEDLLYGRSDEWEGLFVIETAGAGIHALVLVPLPPAAAKCHGQLRPQRTRAEMEHAAEQLRNPPNPDLASLYEFP